MHAELCWLVGFLWRLDPVRRESKTGPRLFFESECEIRQKIRAGKRNLIQKGNQL